MPSVVKPKRGRYHGNVFVNSETKAEKERRQMRERELLDQQTRDITAGRLDTFTGRRTPIFSDE